MFIIWVQSGIRITMCVVYMLAWIVNTLNFFVCSFSLTKVNIRFLNNVDNRDV